MQKSCRFRTALVFVLALLSFPSESLFAQERRVVDDADRDVVLDGRPERIVATSPANTALILSLGVGERVVGVTSLVEYLSYAPDLQEIAAEKAKVGDATGLNIERIVGLSPDLVLLDGDQQQSLARLEELSGQADFSIYVNSPNDIEGVMENLGELGQLVGANSQARRVVSRMRGELEELDASVSELEQRLSVAYIIFGPDPLWTAGGETFLGRAFARAGLDNVFADVGGYTQVSREQVIERNPDVVILSPDVPIDVDEVPRFFGSSLAAVENDRVFRVRRELGSMLEQRQTEVTRGMLELHGWVYEGGEGSESAE